MRPIFLLLPVAATLLAVTGFDAAPSARDHWAYDGDAVPQAQAIQRVSAQRARWVGELLDGKATLAKTAARFHELCKDDAHDHLASLRALARADACENELHFRHVVFYAERICRSQGLDDARLEPIRREIEDRSAAKNWNLE